MTSLYYPDPYSQACNLELQKPGMFVFSGIASSPAYLPATEAPVLNPILPYCPLLPRRLNGCLPFSDKALYCREPLRAFVSDSTSHLPCFVKHSPRGLSYRDSGLQMVGVSPCSNSHPETGWKSWESPGKHRYMRDVWIPVGGYDALTCRLSGHCRFSMLLSILSTCMRDPAFTLLSSLLLWSQASMYFPTGRLPSS